MNLIERIEPATAPATVEKIMREAKDETRRQRALAKMSAAERKAAERKAKRSRATREQREAEAQRRQQEWEADEQRRKQAAAEAAGIRPALSGSQRIGPKAALSAVPFRATPTFTPTGNADCSEFQRTLEHNRNGFPLINNSIMDFSERQRTQI